MYKIIIYVNINLYLYCLIHSYFEDMLHCCVHVPTALYLMRTSDLWIDMECVQRPSVGFKYFVLFRSPYRPFLTLPPPNLSFPSISFCPPLIFNLSPLTFYRPIFYLLFFSLSFANDVPLILLWSLFIIRPFYTCLKSCYSLTYLSKLSHDFLIFTNFFSHHLLGQNPQLWLQKYAADNLRFVEFERKALPCALMRPCKGKPSLYRWVAYGIL